MGTVKEEVCRDLRSLSGLAMELSELLAGEDMVFEPVWARGVSVMGMLLSNEVRYLHRFGKSATKAKEV